MRVLITGGCGFIGSHFINFIKRTEPNTFVMNIDRIDYCSNIHNIEVDCKTEKIDIKDRDGVLKILIENDIDTVVHFAAQSHVDNSFSSSIDFTIDNTLGTHSLLEACRLYKKIFKFIHISTDEVYGETAVELNENTRLNPTNPYAASKAAAECIVKSYYYSFKLPIVICRMNNVYGKNQYPEKVIPKFIACLKNDKKMPIQGFGRNRRSFIHVEDVCSGIYTVLKKGHVPEIYNIGTSSCDISVLELAHMLLTFAKPGEKLDDWIEFVEDRNFNDSRYLIDSEKIKKLGWKETDRNFEDELYKLFISTNK